MAFTIFLGLHTIQLLRFCWCPEGLQTLVDQRKAFLTFYSQKHLALLNLFGCSFFSTFVQLSGDEGIRTPDLRRAKAALSQLSYIPVRGTPIC